MTPEEFQTQFQSRSLAYVPGLHVDRRPVVIALGRNATSVPAHAMALTLTNLLARSHPRLVVIGKLDEPFRGRAPFGTATLANATVGLARAINPFVEVEVAQAIPDERLVSFGIEAELGVDIPLGCEGWLAKLGEGAIVDSDLASIWGAMLASIYASQASFNLMRGGDSNIAGVYSLWGWGVGQEQGPAFAGPLDIGRVLQAGAGGVGAALGFFASLIGVVPTWWIADGDNVDVTNLNRQLLFVARQAGYPDGEPENKAVIAAEALGATASPYWYGEDVELVEANYDVVLALANDHGARSFLQARQPTVLLHATTSTNFAAQFHRHITGIDDCIECRLPPGVLDLGCATNVIQVSGHSFDAAVGHVSAAAGLLVLAGLARLQLGALASLPTNKISLSLEGSRPFLQAVTAGACKPDCMVRLPDTARRELVADERFAQLDPTL
jgi:hypothetical protein